MPHAQTRPTDWRVQVSGHTQQIHVGIDLEGATSPLQELYQQTWHTYCIAPRLARIMYICKKYADAIGMRISNARLMLESLDSF